MNSVIIGILVFGGTFAVSYLVTPLAAVAARRTNFLDHPQGYKEHARSTPYLGGTAVVLPLLLCASLMADDDGRITAVLGCAAVLWFLGTLDDRRPVGPYTRLLAEGLGGVVLLIAGIKWTVFEIGVFDSLLTILWVVGLTNAFNLMDNIDGAASTVACVSGVGIAGFGAFHGETEIAFAGAALAGSTAGFLPHNLAAPAKIFLGDGGSMPIGFLVAGFTLIIVQGHLSGGTGFIAATLLAGLPVLDTCLVMISRRRRGVSIFTAGRDHLTHRLLRTVKTERRLALTLAVTQLLLAGGAIAGAEGRRVGIALVAIVAGICGAAAVYVLEFRQTASTTPDHSVARHDPITVHHPTGEGRSAPISSTASFSD